MLMEHAIIGVVATSRAGRDKGRRFAVIGVADESSVYIADGDTRKLTKPKRKKLKHLSLSNARIALDEALEKGDKAAADAMLRKALAVLDTNRFKSDEEG
jgi:ribosomal protein L14E/L6E/L27E